MPAHNPQCSFATLISSTLTATRSDKQKWWRVIERQPLLGESQWGFSTYSSLVLSRSAHESCHLGSQRSSSCFAVFGKMNCVCIEIHEGRLLQLIFLKSLFIYLVWRQEGGKAEEAFNQPEFASSILGSCHFFLQMKNYLKNESLKTQFILHFLTCEGAGEGSNIRCCYYQGLCFNLFDMWEDTGNTLKYGKHKSFIGKLEPGIYAVLSVSKALPSRTCQDTGSCLISSQTIGPSNLSSLHL